MAERRRPGSDGRFSDPPALVVYNPDGTLKSGTPRQAAYLERISRAQKALWAGDPDEYDRIMSEGKDEDEDEDST